MVHIRKLEAADFRAWHNRHSANRNIYSSPSARKLIATEQAIDSGAEFQTINEREGEGEKWLIDITV